MVLHRIDDRRAVSFRRIEIKLRIQSENLEVVGMRLNARFSGGYAAMASVQAARGKFGEGGELYKQSLMLDPNDPEMIVIWPGGAWIISNGYWLASTRGIPSGTQNLRAASTIEPSLNPERFFW